MSTNKLSTREAAKILQVRPNLLEAWRASTFAGPCWRVMCFGTEAGDNAHHEAYRARRS